MVGNLMKKINVATFVSLLKEDLRQFKDSIDSGIYQDRNSHEWFKLLNDWVEYGFSRRATEEWSEYSDDDSN